MGIKTLCKLYSALRYDHETIQLGWKLVCLTPWFSWDCPDFSTESLVSLTTPHS